MAKKRKLFKWVFLGIVQAASAAISLYFMKKETKSSLKKKKSKVKESFYDSLGDMFKSMADAMK